MKKSLVAVASHPDDEVLTAGALLLRARANGLRIHLIWANRGQASSSISSTQRWNEAIEVAQKLDASYEHLDLDDGKITIGAVLPKVEIILNHLQPHVVVWPYGHGAEQHQDHRGLHEALVNISKRWQYAKSSWLAGQPPVYDDRTFTPNLFLPFGETLMSDFMGLMDFYISERRKPFAKHEFLERRAIRWAHEGETKTSFAEPFVLIKGNPPVELFQSFPVDFFKESDGKQPVLDYIESLEATEEATTLGLIKYLHELGPALQSPYSVPLTSGLHMLCVDHEKTKTRILYFEDQDERFILLHAFSAETDTVPTAHLHRAMARKEEFLKESKGE